MKNVKQLIVRHKYEGIAGAATFFVLFLAFMFSGIISVTGRKSILVCDMYGQYYEFLIGIRRIILSGESLVYSWNLDMGIGLVGWIAYYVASPFNLILLLVPESWLIGTVTFLILLKLSLSSVTFAYYLKKVLKIDGAELVIGAFCYSLSSFAITYFYQIMWLDILIWLPLLVVYMKKIADGKGSLGFTVCLTISFFSNYYVSFMTGMFLFTCFVVYYVYQQGNIFSRQFLKRFFKFAGSAVLAFGLGGILLVPTISQMTERLVSKNSVSKSSLFNFDLIDLLQSTTWGNYFSFFDEKPLLYASCFILLLIVWYFVNQKIPKKEKKSLGILLAVWLIIALLRPTDLFMHIGKTPTQFPCRYAFVISFLFVTVGVRQLHLLFQDGKAERAWGACGVLTAICILSVILDCSGIKELVSIKNIMISLILFVSYTLLFILLSRKKLNRKDFTVLLSFLLIAELLANSLSIYRGMDDELGFKDYTKIRERQILLKKQLSSLEKEEEPYRIEKNYRLGYNDGFAFGYSSISSFSSVYNTGVHKFLANMGVSNQLWNSSFRGSTTFLNSILGIKYILHAVTNQDTILRSGPVDSIEKNNFALPLGFMVDDKIQLFTLTDENSLSPMEKQQELLYAITGDENSKNCFETFEPDSIICDNVTRDVRNGKIMIKPANDDKDAFISYYVTGDGTKEYYFYPQFDNQKYETKYVEAMTQYNLQLQSQFTQRMNLGVPCNIRLLDSPGATNDILKFQFHKDETVVFDKELFYSFDKAEYEKYYTEMSLHSMSIQKFENGYFSGNVDAGKKSGIFLLTVPYNVKWNIYVDGKKTDIISVCQDTFMGVRLEAGIHTITAVYQDASVRVGKITTFASILILAAWLFCSYKQRT